MIKKFLIAAMLVSTFGCTSFRTTALYRFSNDSVVPQKTNKKLKGLPVKLKVPSHVQVTVYEQQVILANSEGATENKVQDAKEAADAVQLQKDDIAKLGKNVETINASIVSLAAAETEIRNMINSAKGDQKVALQASLDANTKKQADAQVSLAAAIAASATLPEELAKLRELEAASAVAARDAAIKYTLVSFTPAQYIVERELQYTDKVFLVDFKRPAGGILNLTEASMDDEQYFSKVQAEITERTLADVGYALKTVADPLSKLGKKQQGNTAIPTSSETPVAETNNNVNFQKSVIATQRFDISDAGWEERLQAFVSEFIAVDNGQSDLPGYPMEMVPEYSEGQIHSGVN